MDNFYEPYAILSIPGEIGIIGYGYFTTIRECFHKKTGRCALKYLSYTGATKSINDVLKRFSNEIKLLNSVSHRNLAQVYGITLHGNTFGILIELLEGGNLGDLIHSQDISDISWDLRLRIVTEISEGLCYLHEFTKDAPLIHGNLNTNKVMLSFDFHAKIGGFGTSKMVFSLGPSTPFEQSKRSLFYTAPEVLRDLNAERGPAIDMYSFSMIMYEVLTKEQVYKSSPATPDLIIAMIASRSQRPDKKPLSSIKEILTNQFPVENLKCFNVMMDVMQKSWTQEPQDRIPATEARTLLSRQLESLDDSLTIAEAARLAKLRNRTKNDVTMMTSLPSCLSHTAQEITVEVPCPTISVSESESSMLMFVSVEPGQCEVIGFLTERRTFYNLPSLQYEWDDSTAAIIDQTVYAIGSNFNEYLNMGDANPAWKSFKRMITPRSHASCAAFKDKIYVYGGLDQNRSPLLNFECYDVISNTWSEVGTSKKPRLNHSMLSIQESVYIVGGSHNIIEKYDPSSQKISDVTKLPKRDGFSAVYCDNIIYNIGRSNKIVLADDGSKVHAVYYGIDCYNLQTNSWYKINDLKTNRSQGRACAIDGKVYIVGGWGKLGGRQYIEMFCPLSGEWSTITSMNYGFVQHVCSTNIIL